MNNKFRIVSTICIVVLFTVNSVLGSYMSDLVNLTDHNESVEEDTMIERAIEAGICESCNIEQNKEPVLEKTPVQTPVSLPVSQPSSGIGIVVALVILSALYISGKKR